MCTVCIHDSSTASPRVSSFDIVARLDHVEVTFEITTNIFRETAQQFGIFRKTKRLFCLPIAMNSRVSLRQGSDKKAIQRQAHSLQHTEHCSWRAQVSVNYICTAFRIDYSLALPSQSNMEVSRPKRHATKSPIVVGLFDFSFLKTSYTSLATRRHSGKFTTSLKKIRAACTKIRRCCR